MFASDISSVVDGLIGRAAAILSKHGIARDYRVADSILRVTASSSFLAEQYAGSLAHLLLTPQQRIDFEIFLLDSESCGIPFPASFNKIAAEDSLLSARNSSENDQIFSGMDDENTLCVANLRTNRAVCWLRKESLIRDCLPARPLRNIIHWWMAPRGFQLCHAGAIGNDYGAVLFVGPSGAGKSTTSLNLLAAGMNYFGDDYVIVGPGPEMNTPSVYSLYSWSRIGSFSKSLAQISDLQATAVYCIDKFTVPLNGHFNNKLKPTSKLRAIVCLSVSETEGGRLTPIAKAQVFRQAIPTLGHLPGHERLTVRNLALYIGQLPVYALEVGNDIEHLQKVVEALLPANGTMEHS